MSPCGCAKTPCGCKSTGVAIATRNCGCGGTGCAACEPRAYVRPRFFAGQLLTEDDLALAGDYVVAKNRLHNRALWGPGVVCGLDVNCDPCGGGHIVVQPGYAINCCGDDIVVPCPESVDVLALIRDLRKHSLGAECADPCEEPRPSRQPAPPAPPTTIMTPAGATAPVQPNPKAPVRRYYLYIRYVEDLTDPVSPYATDEPCAGQACEPTRIREGHRYELRCENDNPRFAGLGDRFTKCIGDLKQARAAAAEATVINRVALRVDTAQRALAQTPAPVFSASDVTAFQTASSDLGAAIKQLSASPASSAAVAGAGPSPADADTVRRAIEALRVSGSLMARLSMTPVRQRPAIDQRTTREASQTFSKALAALKQALPGAGFEPLETAEATATLELAAQFSKLANPPAKIAPNERLWALGAPLTDALFAETRAAQARIQAYVAPRVQASPRLSDCELLALLEGIRPIAAGPIDAVSIGTLTQFGTLTSQVLGRLLFECLCDGFNPPCQSCDDPAVLLAELCVQDCVVIDICEMVRRFVITWPSVRYWTDIPNFPLNLNAIGERVETLCCELRAQLGSGCPPMALQVPGTVIARASDSSLSALLAPRTATAVARKAGDAPFDELGDLLSMIEPLTTVTAVVPGGATSVLDAAVERTIEGRVKDAVAAALASTERELAALRVEVDRLSGGRG